MDSARKRENSDKEMALEELKWKNRKEELQFLEAGQHLRSLNQFLWQAPGMAIAITGGIWYGITMFSAPAAKIAALLFVAMFNFATILVICRLRSLIAIQLKIKN